MDFLEGLKAKEKYGFPFSMQSYSWELNDGIEYLCPTMCSKRFLKHLHDPNMKARKAFWVYREHFKVTQWYWVNHH